MAERRNNQIFIGIDTSCYTSSAACVCIDGIVSDKRTLLEVKQGERGLRQSDAVFQHTRNMAELLPEMLNSLDPSAIRGIGFSERPSGRENSYMPVFLVGRLLAKTVGASLGVPVLGFTHQQGHIRAALLGNEDLIGSPFFAFHLSGGTSELLRVNERLDILRIGGSSDINAGQLVDRVGVRLGLGFPSGKALEALAREATEAAAPIPSSVRGTEFSFSGAETGIIKAIERGEEPRAIALSVYELIARTLAKTIKNTLLANPQEGSPAFLFSGGVASSLLLREMLVKRICAENVRLFFSKPELSSDNAVGAALLCMDEFTRKAD